jgi:hypothetical protein
LSREYTQMTMVTFCVPHGYNHLHELSLTLPVSVLQAPLRSKLLPFITGLVQNQHRRYWIRVLICKSCTKSVDLFSVSFPLQLKLFWLSGALHYVCSAID